MTDIKTEIKEEHSCSFCGKSQYDVNKLVIGPSVYICNDCVELCNAVINESMETGLEIEKGATPEEIHNYLNKYIVGQDKAKKVLSVAAYNHSKRIRSEDPSKFAKSNVLLIGPSGCGKTLICKQLASFLSVPFVITDATSLTEAGYVGDDADSILTSLIENADGNVELAQKGIIYIDEIDKLANKVGPNTSRDVSGEGVQQGLLKLIEGAEVQVAPNFSKSSSQPVTKTKFNTENILFICGGSFPGLDEMISKRTSTHGIGMTASLKKTNEKLNDLLPQVTAGDLEKYGMIKEFIGRLPVITTLDELTEEEMASILTEPENSIISQFAELFKKDGVHLVFDKEAILEIAKEAIETKTGARGLRSIIEKALLEAMYKIPSTESVDSVVVSKKTIRDKVQPLYIEKVVSPGEDTKLA